MADIRSAGTVDEDANPPLTDGTKTEVDHNPAAIPPQDTGSAVPPYEGRQVNVGFDLPLAVGPPPLSSDGLGTWVESACRRQMVALVTPSGWTERHVHARQGGCTIASQTVCPHASPNRRWGTYDPTRVVTQPGIIGSAAEQRTSGEVTNSVRSPEGPSPQRPMVCGRGRRRLSIVALGISPACTTTVVRRGHGPPVTT